MTRKAELLSFAWSKRCVLAACIGFAGIGCATRSVPEVTTSTPAPAAAAPAVIGQPAHRGEPTPAVLATLSKRIPANVMLEPGPLSAAIDNLRLASGAEIELDQARLELEGIPANVVIGRVMRQVTLRQALNELCRSGAGKLAYVTEGERIIITTADDASIRGLTAQTYDVNRLLPAWAPEMNPEARAERDQFVEAFKNLIRSSIAAESWKENGGVTGSVQELGGQLIVVQTPFNQLAVRQLLEKLRESAASRAG